ncbi:Fe2+-enterobactin ABC transporter substrate-binding protein [Demequina sp.]|uniref:Fe2+-enterobactin ABC transporter substrate-binding protein n=1 Tax=Demequina sp. TaxID=2050685 RepID=UPI003A8A487E
MALRHLSATVALAAAAVVTMAGCSSDATPEDEVAPTTTTTDPADTPEVEEAAFPRTITHELGETVLETQPERIAVTALTVTGNLLAIGAPVVASAASTPDPGLTDDNGFFAQWADEATATGVDVLYPNLEFDIEAVIASDPDLIIASTTGADAAADYYDELSEIAPTIVVNYSDKTWQEVATLAGEWTGLEAEAAEAIASFDARVAEVAESITIPEGTTQAVVFNNLEWDSAVAKQTGAHATLLSSLGFDVVEADASLDTSETARDDFAFVAPENLSAAFTGDTLFLVNGTDTEKEALLGSELLQEIPAVVNNQVYPLGKTSFRIDYYSALGVVDLVEGYFGG